MRLAIHGEFFIESFRPKIPVINFIVPYRFISMESEEDAKDTILDLKLKRRLFRSQPVKARLKTETIIRSYYQVQPGLSSAAMYPPALPFSSFSPIVPDMRPYIHNGGVGSGSMNAAAAPAPPTTNNKISSVKGDNIAERIDDHSNEADSKSGAKSSGSSSVNRSGITGGKSDQKKVT